MEEIKKQLLKEKALEIRKMTIDAIGFLGVGHVGGAMSIIETLTVLYYEHMTVDPENPKKIDRDRLILSKGHAGPALYSTLASKGFFPKNWLHTLNQGGTKLPSHCDMNLTPGIDMTTGSLGQGLSAAVGMALANRLDSIDRNVYCIIGDGESDEGQNWEAGMAAAQFKVNKLIAFTDYNNMQLDGYINEILGLDDLCAKWKSFGWNVLRVDGHDMVALSDAIYQAKAEETRPTMIIMDTIKGKGIPFAEGKLSNHNMPVDYEEAKKVIAEMM